MRHKLYVMFVFCVLASSAMGVSIPGEPQKYALPSRNTKPKKILTAASSDVMAKLILSSTSSLSELDHNYMNKNSATNTFTSTRKVMIIVSGSNVGKDGFKLIGYRNTGPIPWKNVTATIKANILHVQGVAYIGFTLYKNGNYAGIHVEETIHTKGSISITTPPFTIETGSDWHTIVEFCSACSSPNRVSSVVGTVGEVSLDFGK